MDDEELDERGIYGSGLSREIWYPLARAAIAAAHTASFEIPEHLHDEPVAKLLLENKHRPKALGDAADKAVHLLVPNSDMAYVVITKTI